MIILTIAIVLIAAFLIFTSSRPDNFRIERSININASPEKIFPFINNFHNWELWSPWEKVDPNCQRKFDGANSGVASSYEWEGNKDLGHGRMEIIESNPNSRLLIKIDFFKPFKASNTVEFLLEKNQDSVKLTQAMFGCNSFVGKLIGLFCSMEKIVGEKYEEGLTSIKTLAEK